MKYLKTYEAKLIAHQQWRGEYVPGPYQKVLKPLDPEYFNMVFADFIDQGAEIDFYGKDEDDMENCYWKISIKEPEVKGSRNIDNHIKTIEKLNELYLDVKSCINKVKDEYPHIDVDFSILETGENTAWENTIERNIHLVFSYK